MKVLQEGSGNGGWTKEVKCTGKGNREVGCGAKLLVSRDDLFRTESSDYAGYSTDYYITVQCPLCKELTDLPQSKVPFHASDLRKPTRAESQQVGR